MEQIRPRAIHVRSLVASRALGRRLNRAAHARAARRRARPLALASAGALTCTILPARHASAQTWAAPNSGSWSVVANWIGGTTPPVSSLTTRLEFDATGSDTYTATNNLAPTPFVLNAMTFGNTGGGLITVDGSAIGFDGANPTLNLLGAGSSRLLNAIQLLADTAVSGPGAGTVALQGAISASPASARSLIADAPNGNLVLAGGASLYGLKVNSGSAWLAGGTYTLASAQHGNDPFGNTSDGGFWSVVAGDSPAQTGRLTVSSAAVLNAQNAFVANATGAAGIATFSGAGTTVNLPTTGNEGRLGVNFGSGTINVLAGAAVNARRVDLGRQNNSIGYLLVDGANSRVSPSQSFSVPAGSSATGTAVISNGGQVSVTGGFGFIGAATDSSNNPMPSNGVVTVTGANSLLNIGTSGGGNNGQLLIGIGAAAVGAAGRLELLAGGRAQAANTFVGRGLGVGTLLIDGAASRLVNTNQIAISSAAAVPSQLTLANGGTLSSGNSLFAGLGTFDTAIVNITGPSSLATAPLTVLGGGNGAGQFGGNATLNISGGGELRSDLVLAAENPFGRATVAVDGANSRLTVSDQLIASDDAGATSAITISNGATLSVVNATYLSPAAASTSALTITGAGASFASGSTTHDLHAGGAFGLAGGSATVNVTNGASANVSRSTLVYARSALNVGSATTPATFATGSGGLIVDGVVHYNSGTLTSSGTLSVGGSVLLSGAGAGRLNKKTLEVAMVSLTASGVVDLNDNDLLTHGTSKALIQSHVNNARHGGAWDNPGITSSAARDNANHNTTLGVLSGSEYASMNGGTSQFNGRSFTSGDVLVKYTYYGDTDFNGTVNFDDYVRIDNGFNNHLSGWMNGDFDGNGVVNFDDYVLIDLAFNTQGAALLKSGRAMATAGGADLLAGRELVSTIAARNVTEPIAGPSVPQGMRVSHAQPFGGAHPGETATAEFAGTEFISRAVPEPSSSGMFGTAALLVGTCVPRGRRYRSSGGSLVARHAPRVHTAGVLS